MYVKVRILTANEGHWLNIQKMRTCFKRVVFAMLFMAMALSLSAHDIEQDGIYYDVVSISELTVKAVGLAGNKEGDVVIPEQIVLNGRNYVDGVLNSYFTQNPLTPMKFDIPKEVQPFYPNNQKEIGESIWQIFNIGKHMS